MKKQTKLKGMNNNGPLYVGVDVHEKESQLAVLEKEVLSSWKRGYPIIVGHSCSIVAGCEHTVSINHRLVPDVILARELIGKDRFADQSGVNRLLHAFTEENLHESLYPAKDLLRMYHEREGMERSSSATNRVCT